MKKLRMENNTKEVSNGFSSYAQQSLFSSAAMWGSESPIILHSQLMNASPTTGRIELRLLHKAKKC